MKILILIGLKNNKKISGGQYSIFKLGNEISKSHDVLFAYDNSMFGKENNTDSIKIPYFHQKGKIFTLLNLILEYLYDLFVLSPLMRRRGFDLIIGSQKSTAVKASKLGQKYNVKTGIFIFETPLWLCEKWPSWKIEYDNSSKLQKNWEKFKKAIVESDIIIANSRLTAEQCYKWSGRKPEEVVYPGFDPSYEDVSDIRKENQIIYLGRLEENKNIDEIIKALALVNTDTKFVICGTGSKENELKNLAKSKGVNAEFKGNVSEKEKWIELKKSLFMVFPSSFEGFGMPPMEALSVGTPCICSDIPIFREIYKDYVEYFQEHDIKKLANRIEHYLNNKIMLIHIGNRGNEYVNKYFGWAMSEKKLDKLLSTLS